MQQLCLSGSVHSREVLQGQQLFKIDMWIWSLQTGCPVMAAMFPDLYVTLVSQ